MYNIVETTCPSPVLNGLLRDTFLERAIVARLPHARVRLSLVIDKLRKTVWYLFGICTGGFLVLNRQAGTDVVSPVTKQRAGLSKVH